MRLLFILALAATIGTGGPARSCALKLLLSWDVSPSMTVDEYRIQRNGTAQAFRHPRIKNAISLSRGGVAVALLQWAGPEEQELSVPWVKLRDGRDAEAFADVIDGLANPFGARTGTAIGNGLRHAGDHLARGPVDCSRLVVDVSGDGATNTGVDTASEADVLALAQVTINGLVLPAKEKVHADDPYMFYVRNVARGPNSFVMDVFSYADFPRAMTRKLLRELQVFASGETGRPATRRAANDAPRESEG